ncbi:DUF6191 domain-containing protein [Streptomyces sp. NPDC059766]|uniref:DUF6191 domain-containing protein n=1 Tax=Streptomyces sp. NPDC059766 TaxID=3346940 RepID=UPI00365A2527
MFDAFAELFAPGRKHTRDEQNRLELTREDTGDSDPGRGPIDLTSGKVVVRLPPPEAEPEPDVPDLGPDASDPDPDVPGADPQPDAPGPGGG